VCFSIHIDATINRLDKLINHDPPAKATFIHELWAMLRSTVNHQSAQVQTTIISTAVDQLKWQPSCSTGVLAICCMDATSCHLTAKISRQHQ
jgi:hypothetical protein